MTSLNLVILFITNNGGLVFILFSLYCAVMEGLLFQPREYWQMTSLAAQEIILAWRFRSELNKLRKSLMDTGRSLSPSLILKLGYCTLKDYAWRGGLSSSLSQQIQHFNSLTFLLIYDFSGLDALPEWLGNLTSLTNLIIRWCKNLLRLPTVEDMQRLTKLQVLINFACPLLEQRCTKDSGTEWPKISRIPNIRIKGNLFFLFKVWRLPFHNCLSFYLSIQNQGQFLLLFNFNLWNWLIIFIQCWFCNELLNLSTHQIQ